MLGKVILKGVKVFLKKTKVKHFVGELYREDNKGFVFRYDEKYINSKRSLSLGWDLPIKKIEHRANKLFPFFNALIPERKSSEYKKRCIEMGISEKERDQIKLLSAIGETSSSSFILEPLWEDAFTFEDVKKFRESLQLTLREFSACFEVPLRTLCRIEEGASRETEVLKRVAIYCHFPEVATWQIKKAGGMLDKDKRSFLYKELLKVKF